MIIAATNYSFGRGACIGKVFYLLRTGIARNLIVCTVRVLPRYSTCKTFGIYSSLFSQLDPLFPFHYFLFAG